MMTRITLAIAAVFAAVPALADNHGGGDNGFIALAAGIAIGVAAFGGALGQGKIGASAMEGIARNPQAQKSMFVPMILGLVLIESLVIYALVVAFNLAGKF